MGWIPPSSLFLVNLYCAVAATIQARCQSISVQIYFGSPPSIWLTKMQTTKLYFTLGRPLAPLYSAAMRLRETCYRRGIFRSHRLDVPVISVGNLTMGGTGKTPMVQCLARLLLAHGFRPAIISRGYGGSARGKVNLVSDGTNLLLEARVAGDEPRFLAETLPGVPVLTGIVRRLPAQMAVEMGYDVLLLDDGFQHMQIARDVNMVLFHADRLAGNSRVFPGGGLREPVAALHRATNFILTGVHDRNRERAQQFAALLQARFPQIPLALTGYQVAATVRLSTGGMIEEVDTDFQIEDRCFGFCGIANPESFRSTLEQCGCTLAGFIPLGDHQRYTLGVIGKIAAQARQAGAKFLVTTEKDLVKLGDYAADLPLPLLGLRMEVTVDEALVQSVLNRVRAGIPSW
jgi:tetraacyldisaccharide 4'-kinase